LKKLSICAAMASAMALGSCGAERHAAKHHGKSAATVVVERSCMVSIELTEKTECAGIDGEHLRCSGLLLKYTSGCEKVRIER